jgi:hypothetical protein
MGIQPTRTYPWSLPKDQATVGRKKQGMETDDSQTMSTIVVSQHLTLKSVLSKEGCGASRRLEENIRTSVCTYFLSKNGNLYQYVHWRPNLFGMSGSHELNTICQTP